MHIPLLRALDPYVHGQAVAHGDRTKAAEIPPFVVESVPEKPESRKNLARARSDDDAPEDEAPPFEGDLPAGTENDAPLPEDAFDAQDLCALLEAAAPSRG